MLAILTAGATLRLWRLDDASLWLDEAGSVLFASLPWSTLWLTGYDNAPPLYYSFLKVFLYIGDSEFWIRLPSALFGIITIPVVYAAGQLVAGRWAGLVAAAVLAFSATQIEYSQEARAYSLLTLALAVALVGLLMIVTRDRNWRAGGSVAHSRDRLGMGLYGAGILAALYTNNAAVFFVFVAQLTFAVFWWTRRQPRLLLLWLGVNGAVFVAWLPWLVIVLNELLGNGSMAWLQQPAAVDAFRQWRQVNGFTFLWKAQPIPDLVLLGLCGLGVFRLRRQPATAFALLSVCLLGPLLIWLVGFYQPLYMERTIVWGFIGVPVLAGVAATLFNGWKAMSVLVVLSLPAARSALAYHELGIAENEDWRAARETWLAAANDYGPLGPLYFCSPQVVLPFFYYSKEAIGLPPMITWGAASSGFAATAVLPRATAPSVGSAADRMRRLPADIFRWKRGAVDAGRQPVQSLPVDHPWRSETWTSFELIDSHCPDDARKALDVAARRHGWQAQEPVGFDGGRVSTFVCMVGRCRIPVRHDDSIEDASGGTTSSDASVSSPDMRDAPPKMPTASGVVD